MQKRIGSIVRATSSGGATNSQLTETANPTIRSIRSTTQLSRYGFVWLPATCHSIGKFPFRHAATFATDSQSCKNYNSRKIFIFCSIGNLFFFLFSFPAVVALGEFYLTQTHHHNCCPVSCEHMLSISHFFGLRFPRFDFIFSLSLSLHIFNDNFVLHFSFSSVSVFSFDNRLLS